MLIVFLETYGTNQRGLQRYESANTLVRKGILGEGRNEKVKKGGAAVGFLGRVKVMLAHKMREMQSLISRVKVRHFKLWFSA